VPPGRPPGEALDEIRWMLEELRVGLFAQTLGTPRPISEKRILRAMDAVAV
jgi:ATP-dependent helicase HrpA